jgi:hypothetical protein
MKETNKFLCPWKVRVGRGRQALFSDEWLRTTACPSAVALKKDIALEAMLTARSCGHRGCCVCRSKRSREEGNPVILYPREKLSYSLLGKSWLPSGGGEVMT